MKINWRRIMFYIRTVIMTMMATTMFIWIFDGVSMFEDTNVIGVSLIVGLIALAGQIIDVLYFNTKEMVRRKRSNKNKKSWC